MQSFRRSFLGIKTHTAGSKFMDIAAKVYRISCSSGFPNVEQTHPPCGRATDANFFQHISKHCAFQVPLKSHTWSSVLAGTKICAYREVAVHHELLQYTSIGINLPARCITTGGQPEGFIEQDNCSTSLDELQPRRIKFKRLDKTAKHIMNILDKEAVEKVKADREFPDIKPGYIIQLKVEVPENKRRLSILKGIVIARRNAGLNTTFRLRRLVAGVGVESVFPLYSPNIKEMKVLDKKRVRRAKLYYLRDRMNPLKK